VPSRTTTAEVVGWRMILGPSERTTSRATSAMLAPDDAVEGDISSTVTSVAAGPVLTLGGAVHGAPAVLGGDDLGIEGTSSVGLNVPELDVPEVEVPEVEVPEVDVAEVVVAEVGVAAPLDPGGPVEANPVDPDEAPSEGDGAPEQPDTASDSPRSDPRTPRHR